MVQGGGGTYFHAQSHSSTQCTYTDQESTQLLVSCVLTRVHYDDIVCAVFLSCGEQALYGYYDSVTSYMYEYTSQLHERSALGKQQLCQAAAVASNYV